ncbi:MAG: AraC family transcriptional regulator [Chromatiales bacterium]|nr:AraC family transcriptional regulator [Chromatiales bacterium]
MWLASSTLREAMQRLIRYQRVMSTVLGIELVDGPRGMLLRWKIAAAGLGGAPAPASIDASLAVIVGWCRQTAGGAIRPRRVYLPHPQPPCAERLFSYFRAPVELSSAQTALEFSPRRNR